MPWAKLLTPWQPGSKEGAESKGSVVSLQTPIEGATLEEIEKVPSLSIYSPGIRFETRNIAFQLPLKHTALSVIRSPVVNWMLQICKIRFKTE